MNTSDRATLLTVSERFEVVLKRSETVIKRQGTFEPVSSYLRQKWKINYSKTKTLYREAF
jgi:hypothetical protein